jgi:hypothetical protein
VLVPNATVVIVFPLTVATEVELELYVKVPAIELVTVGVVTVYVTFLPLETLAQEKVGTPLLTVIDTEVEVLAAAWFVP